MKREALIVPALLMLVLSCSKGGNGSDALAGHWTLIKQCCGGCSVAIDPVSSQTLDFTSDGKAQLTGFIGDSAHSYSGTYFISGSGKQRILNIKLDGPDSVQGFLAVPGSYIDSLSSSQLVLDINTPAVPPCQRKNIYQLLTR